MADTDDTGDKPRSLIELDRFVQANVAASTLGVSPAGMALSFADWALHLIASPGTQLHLAQKTQRKLASLGALLAYDNPWSPIPPVIEPLPGDSRFRHEAWRRWPFDIYHQAFLLAQQWLHVATDHVPGARRHSLDVVNFATRQMLDVISPSNFVASNPEVLGETVRTGGFNFLRGLANFQRDAAAAFADKPAARDTYVPGRDVAVTPGQVVFKNRLIELIRYDPVTPSVNEVPLLIVPAWIMKYYILDLAPENSLIRHLVAQGRTVFAISWHNPDEGDRGLSMEDYRRLGVMAALDAISETCPNARIDALGYCLGGTLLAIAACAMARDGDRRLRSLILLAAQVDFSEPGELSLFIDDSEVNFIQSMMWRHGYLDTRQMAGAFQLLRSNDLIWSRMVRAYLLGEDAARSDLMAWNADATRMPYRMHAEYLRTLFLENDLSGGRFLVDGRPIALSDVAIPIFAVGTERDHVAPWRSAYKIGLFASSEVTFVLTSGGHNVGIVNPPGLPDRYYRIGTLHAGAPFVDPDTWFVAAERRDGSWWTALDEWLTARGGASVPPPAPSRGLAAAPGAFVLET